MSFLKRVTATTAVAVKRVFKVLDNMDHYLVLMDYLEISS